MSTTLYAKVPLRPVRPPMAGSPRTVSLLARYGMELLGHPCAWDPELEIVSYTMPREDGREIPMTMNLGQFAQACHDGNACRCWGCFACACLSLKIWHNVWIQPGLMSLRDPRERPRRIPSDDFIIDNLEYLKS
jgi:hypothetical protein